MSTWSRVFHSPSAYLCNTLCIYEITNFRSIALPLTSFFVIPVQFFFRFKNKGSGRYLTYVPWLGPKKDLEDSNSGLLDGKCISS
jgi:hypothetical protein